MRAMLAGVTDEVGRTVRFTIVHQFRKVDSDFGIDLDQPVRLMRMRARPDLVLPALLPRLARATRWLLSPASRRILDAYLSADVVVSAPGGPYFGDLYADHEIAHWFYVWLAHRLGLPIVLYAPSAGPFENRWLNPVRRRGFGWFARISLRERRSLDHVRALLGAEVPLLLSADAVLQREVSPMDRARFFTQVSRRPEASDRPVVALSAIDWRYPGSADPAAAKLRYERAVLAAVAALHDEAAPHFVLLPQLYGPIHADAGYLERLGSRFPDDVSWEVLDPSADADVHRAVVGMSDLCISSRYHPQIFAATAGVPAVCIHYEHKALAFVEELGLAQLALDIETIEADELVALVLKAWHEREQLAEHLRREVPELSERARQSSEMVADVLAAASS